MDRFYSLKHSSIDFYFKQTPDTFVVEEIPLYEFSNEGEHLVLFVRKKNLSTFELIEIIARYLGIKTKEIGYAGLKDKHALTKQYISIHKKHEQAIKNFQHPNIKILSATYHKNKIKMGHLKGNRFYIKLKKVNPISAVKLDEALKHISKDGMPNFFGYQRFGNDGNNYVEGEKIAKGLKKEKNPKIKRLLINSYQSHLFNLWLSRRLEIGSLADNFEANTLQEILNLPKEDIIHLKKQKHPFKLISGDVLQHYPHGRLFEFEKEQKELDRFYAKEISPTGLLCGKKTKKASNTARIVEKDFDEDIAVDGARRYAWVFVEDIDARYNQDKAWYELNFTLPKGSYATVLLEELAKKKLFEDSE